MQINRLARPLCARLGSLAAAALIALASACADATAPATPAAQLNKQAGTTDVYATTLTRTVPLAENIVVEQWIDWRGGKIEIPETDFRLIVPPNAVSAPTLFTVTALAGDQVAYEFGPHGTVFSRPVKFVQRLDGTNWEEVEDLSQIEGVYFSGVAELDRTAKRVRAREFLPAQLEVHGRRATLDLYHFSGYVLASGRKSTY